MKFKKSYNSERNIGFEEDQSHGLHPVLPDGAAIIRTRVMTTPFGCIQLETTGRLMQRSEKPITCASLGVGSIVVGAIPGRQYYASLLSLPLTHPQPCWAWSMIITWQQVQIMRGESPKSYVRGVRGQTDLLRSTHRRSSSVRSTPLDDRRVYICIGFWLCILNC